MSLTGPLPAAGAENLKSITGQQSLRTFGEQRHVTLDTTKSSEQRERMVQTLKFGEERSLLDATKDLAANLFSAFRNELREALNHIGVGGEKAADLVREIGTAFVEAVREGTSFSFAMVAAAYRETITQTATTASHGLEFSANALTIEYNHVTGDITADTSKMEIDAVKVFSSDNLPAETSALFDFTDSDGPPGIGELFSRVQQYLVNAGFIEAADEEEEIPALPSADENAYDVMLVNNERAQPEGGAPDTETAAQQTADAAARAEDDGADAIRVRAVEEFTNARQEKITRTTFDLMVRVYLGKDSAEPEIFRLPEKNEESFEVTA
jgi:hypothetical protein